MELKNEAGESDEIPVPYSEKISLKKAIEKLPGYMLGKVIHIVCTGEAENELDPDEILQIEIDFDKLKPSTIRELQRYVASCEQFLSNGRAGPAFRPSSADKESDTSSLSSATDTSDS